MISQQLIFGLLGGLGLFLYGMKIMSDGLQKIAGDRMRKVLAALTNNRIMATMVGIVVTAIIQSSSATTVMVIGFVNAGLMSLIQAIGVVLGANIGTTITAQLIAFKITKFALPAIGLGVGLKLFSRKKSWIYFGEAVLGFGLIFYGLSVMKTAFDPIKDSGELNNVFLLIGDHLFLAVLVGALITMIVQSSSATIGITLALATSGLITFECSVAVILGENIGTTITANIAAIGANVAARRTALCHLLFNVIGVAYMLALFPHFINLIESVTPGMADFAVSNQQQAVIYGLDIGDKPYIARHIANTHTLFNILNTLIFLPFIGILATVASKIISGDPGELDVPLKYIDSRMLETPPLALSQARAETVRMAEIAQNCLNRTVDFLQRNDLRMLKELHKIEDMLDMLQKEILNFLVAISQKPITQEASKEVSSLMHMVNDLEKVGDYCENLWEENERKIEKKVSFSDVANAEIDTLAAKTQEFLDYITTALEDRKTDIETQTYALENSIDEMEAQYRQHHITRLNTGECSVVPGLIFIDILHNFEKIGDHTHSISRAIMGKK